MWAARRWRGRRNGKPRPHPRATRPRPARRMKPRLERAGVPSSRPAARPGRRRETRPNCRFGRLVLVAAPCSAPGTWRETRATLADSAERLDHFPPPGTAVASRGTGRPAALSMPSAPSRRGGRRSRSGPPFHPRRSLPLSPRPSRQDPASASPARDGTDGFSSRAVIAHLIRPRQELVFDALTPIALSVALAAPPWHSARPGPRDQIDPRRTLCSSRRPAQRRRTVTRRSTCSRPRRRDPRHAPLICARPGGNPTLPARQPLYGPRAARANDVNALQASEPMSSARIRARPRHLTECDALRPDCRRRTSWPRDRARSARRRACLQRPDQALRRAPHRVRTNSRSSRCDYSSR